MEVGKGQKKMAEDKHMPVQGPPSFPAVELTSSLSREHR